MTPPSSILDYTLEPLYGWRPEPGGWVLVLPPRAPRDIAIEMSAVITASTGFLILYGVVAYFIALNMPPEDSILRVFLVGVGLMAIAQWVLVALRVGWQFRQTPEAGRVAIGAGELRVSGGLPPGLAEGDWTLTEVTAARLESVRGLWGAARRVRLIVTTTTDASTAHTFAWPFGVEVAPVGAKFQELLVDARRSPCQNAIVAEPTDPVSFVDEFRQTIRKILADATSAIFFITKGGHAEDAACLRTQALKVRLGEASNATDRERQEADRSTRHALSDCDELIAATHPSPSQPAFDAQPDDDDDIVRASALREVALGQARAGRIDDARETLARARKLAEERFDDDYDHLRVLLNLVMAQMACGDRSGALSGIRFAHKAVERDDEDLLPDRLCDIAAAGLNCLLLAERTPQAG